MGSQKGRGVLVIESGVSMRAGGSEALGAGRPESLDVDVGGAAALYTYANEYVRRA